MKKPKRTHQSHWKDGTSTQRAQKRRATLNAVAQSAGFASWSAYETAIINGKAIIK